MSSIRNAMSFALIALVNIANGASNAPFSTLDLPPLPAGYNSPGLPGGLPLVSHSLVQKRIAG
jgi:hypothetical protein